MSYGPPPPYQPQPPYQQPPGQWPPTGQFPPPQPPRQGPPKKGNQVAILSAFVALFAFLILLAGIVGMATGGDETPAALSPSATVESASPGLAGLAEVPEPSPPTSAPAAAATTGAPAVKTVAMPKVTGRNAAVAYDQLTKLGFTNIELGSEDENDTLVLWPANWTVTKQSAKAGAKVKTDTLIVLTCTKQG